MPKFEVEIDDKGEFVGDLPSELKGIHERLKATAHGEGFGKGSQKAAEEAKQQIADTIKAEKLRLETTYAMEREKWQSIDDHNKALKMQLEGTLTESRKQMTAIEEAHAMEITRRAESLNKRNAKIEGLVLTQLRALAQQNGARDESLPELEVILRHRIGFNDDMDPFVKGEDGQPAKTAAGSPVAMDVFVKQYLDNHPHHRKPASGRGGDARGGATLHGGHPSAGTPASLEASRRAYDDGDRSVTRINEIFEASRKRPA